MSFELVLIGNMSFSVSALKVLFIFCGFQNFNLAISWYGLLVYLIWIYSASWFFFLCLSCEVFDHYFLNYFSPTLFLIFCNSYGTIVGYCHFSLRFLRFWGFFLFVFQSVFSLLFASGELYFSALKFTDYILCCHHCTINPSLWVFVLIIVFSTSIISF